MKRIAAVDLLLAVGLVALIVAGFSDATSAIELLAHGCAATALVMAGEWMATSGATAGVVTLQVAAGLFLIGAPSRFGRETASFVGIIDLTIGVIAIVVGLAGLGEISYEHFTGRRLSTR